VNCVVVWQCVIGFVRVLFGGVATCYRYGVCTVWWCDSVLCVCSVYCVVELQRVLCTVFVLCGCVTACYMYVACTVW